MYPTLGIGPLQIQTYGIFLLVAFWAGLWLAARLAEWHGLDKDHVYNAGFYALIAGLVGARLGHVLLFFEVYRTDPAQIISLSPGALLPLPGLLAALAALAVYAARYRLPPLRLADVAAPGILLALAIADLGAFLAGRSLGTLSDLPWAVELFGVRRHPVALIEGLALFAWLAALLWLDHRQIPPSAGKADGAELSPAPVAPAASARPPGWLALLTLFGYAAIRLFLEPLRAESLTIGDGWRVAQIIALGAVFVSGILLARMAGAEDQRGGGAEDQAA